MRNLALDHASNVDQQAEIANGECEKIVLLLAMPQAASQASREGGAIPGKSRPAMPAGSRRSQSILSIAQSRTAKWHSPPWTSKSVRGVPPGVCGQAASGVGTGASGAKRGQ